LSGGPEDADTHDRHAGIQPYRIDAVAIVENKPVGVGFRENLPELLERPRGGRVGRGVGVEQTTAAHFDGDENVEKPKCGRHDHTEVTRHQRLRVI
jgi:hypothetical protein